ncbi:MAG: CPBP family intramembrane metalloprotease [Lachnospiraceae bacterium]|nr:CPBP family intramembrane metalloprotease [Lachnospiraceae bacterium]
MNQSYKKKNNPAVVWYLAIIFICTFGLGTLEKIFQTGKFYHILQTGFTALPVVTAWIVRKITGEKSRSKLSLKVWKDCKMWLFCLIVPAILIVLGAVLYFMVFRNEYSKVFEWGQLTGNDARIGISNPILFILICIFISAVCFPIHLLELGEEVGWRGYLLWFQVEKYGTRKAVLVNGFEWGLVHMPLIYFGFNYSNENPGAPWSNMACMMLACIVLGILFSYVTLKTGNCMYAAIMHGVVNIIGEIPVFCSVSLKSGLLGPNPTGLLSMTLLIIMAIVLYFRLEEDSILSTGYPVKDACKDGLLSDRGGTDMTKAYWDGTRDHRL